jgi:glucose/mannose transport system permease protein
MFRYFGSIPGELMDAGKMDGCGFFGIYRHIMLPIAWPAFAVVGIWQFTNIWNDFLIGVVVPAGPRSPVNVAVKTWPGADNRVERPDGGCLIAALPPLSSTWGQVLHTGCW